MRAPFSGCDGPIFGAGRHQAGHFGLGDGDFLAAPVGQRNVGDGVIVEVMCGHAKSFCFSCARRPTLRIAKRWGSEQSLPWRPRSPSLSRTPRMSFPTLRASEAIGNPEQRQHFWMWLWIPGQACGLPGMTRTWNGSTEFRPPVSPAARRQSIARAEEEGNKDIKISLCQFPVRRRRRRDLLGDHLEARERARAERGHDRDVGGIAPARHQDAADARRVVAGVERVPAAAEIDFEPGAEIHRRHRRAARRCRRDSRCSSAPECSCSGTA